jgi:hypothetical protein
MRVDAVADSICLSLSGGFHVTGRVYRYQSPDGVPLPDQTLYTIAGKGKHSSTSQLNLRCFCHSD